MDQCRRCRHSFLEQDDRFCRERMGTAYWYGDKEASHVKPRPCVLLNPGDDCVLFQRKPGWSLRRILERLKP